jgi:hypothetical protein
VPQNNRRNLGHKLGRNLGHKLGRNLGHNLASVFAELFLKVLLAQPFLKVVFKSALLASRAARLTFFMFALFAGPTTTNIHRHIIRIVIRIIIRIFQFLFQLGFLCF